MSQLDLTERTVGEAPAVGLVGELNINTAPAVRRLLMKYVKRSEPNLMLDLTRLHFMDTSGLATLIETHLKVEKYGGRLVLFGLNPQIMEVFSVTRVNQLFQIAETEQEALEALQRSPD